MSKVSDENMVHAISEYELIESSFQGLYRKATKDHEEKERKNNKVHTIIDQYLVVVIVEAVDLVVEAVAGNIWKTKTNHILIILRAH